MQTRKSKDDTSAAAKKPTAKAQKTTTSAKKSVKKATAPAKKAPVKKAAAKAPAAKNSAPAKKAAPKKTAPRKATPKTTQKPPAAKTKTTAQAPQTLKKAPAQAPATKPRTIARSKGAAINFRQPPAAPRYFFTSDIPEQYGHTFINAIPRDPEWIFVYWEVDPQAIESMRKTIGEDVYQSSKQILRLIDVTDTDHKDGQARAADIEINDYANNWYIKVPQPARTYIVEWGRLTPSGAFHPIVRSGPVAMPRDSVSDVVDEQWSTAETDELIRISTASRRIGASEEIQELTAEQRKQLFGGASGELLSSLAISSRRA